MELLKFIKLLSLLSVWLLLTVFIFSCIETAPQSLKLKFSLWLLLLIDRTVFQKRRREGHCLIVCSVIPASLFGLITCSKIDILMYDYEDSDFGGVLSSNFCFWNLYWSCSKTYILMFDFVFILKLFLFSLSCGSCKTLRSQRYTFLPFTFSLLSFECFKWWLWCGYYIFFC